ncbi:MAG: hypothetical protein WBQ41_16355 [Solirubrobacterales bacterium]
MALLGLLVAAAIAFLATRAVSTDIGISSEPPTAGQSLSPTPAKPARHKPRPTTTSTTKRTATVTVPSPVRPSDGGESNDD